MPTPIFLILCVKVFTIYYGACVHLHCAARRRAMPKNNNNNVVGSPTWFGSKSFPITSLRIEWFESWCFNEYGVFSICVVFYYLKICVKIRVSEKIIKMGVWVGVSNTFYIMFTKKSLWREINKSISKTLFFFNSKKNIKGCGVFPF